MELSLQTTVAHRASEVFSRARDELHELFAHMPDVSRIERMQSASRVDSVERTDRLVAVVAPLRLGGRSFSEARWLLRSAWHEPTRSARWQVHVEHPREAMHCEGTITIADTGRDATLVTIAGQLSLRLEALGLRILGPAVAGSIERLVAARVEANLTSLLGAFRSA